MRPNRFSGQGIHVIIDVLRSPLRRSLLPRLAAALVAGWLCWPNPAAAQCTPPPGGEPGCSGVANPVNVVTGNKFQREVDLAALPGVQGLEIVRTYNSTHAGLAGPMGHGWMLSYETRLHAIGNSLQISTADGQYFRFDRSGGEGGTCIAATADSGRLVVHPDADGERYRWTEPARLGGREWVFDAQGRPHTLVAADGVSMTHLQYGRHGELVSVRDSQGRSMTLVYAAHGAGYRGVVAIETPLGRFRYRYEAGRTPASDRPVPGNLAEAALPDGTRRLYHYEPKLQAGHAHRLTGISLVAVTPGGAPMPAERIGTYAYDGSGKAVLSVRGSEQSLLDRVALQYAEPALPGGYERGQRGKTLITNSRGERTEYLHAVIGGQFRLLQVTGPGCASCAESNVRYGWTAQGRLASLTKLSEQGKPLHARHYRYDAQGRLALIERVDFDAHGKPGPSAVLERRAYEGRREEPSLIARPSVAPGREAVVRIAYRAWTHPFTGRSRDLVDSIAEEGYAPGLDGAAPTVLARRTQYRYDAHGRLIEIDGPLADVDDRSRVRYDASGRVAEIALAGGNRLAYSYDALGRPMQLSLAGGVSYRFAYDALGRLAAAAAPAGNEHYWYDAAGRLAQVLMGNGQRLFYRYDAAGRIDSLTDQQNNRIVFARDGEGQVLGRRLLNPDGSLAVDAGVGGDLNDPLASARRLAEESGRSPVASSSGTHRPPSAMLADGAGIVARLQFDSLNRLTRIADARGHATVYETDDFGRTVGVRSPDGGTTRYRYDAADRVVAKLDGAGRGTVYRYDAAGRVAEVVAGSETMQFAYTAQGKPAQVRYPAGEEHFAYDAAGRLAEHRRIVDGRSHATVYRYDARGLLAEKVLPGGQTLQYEYRGPQHPRAGTLAAVYRKDWIGRTPILSGLNDADDGYADRSFDLANGLPLRTRLNRDGSLQRLGTPGVAEIGYEAPGGGPIAAMAVSTGPLTRSDRFGRDAAARLVSWQSGPHRFDRNFDAAGNPLMALRDDGPVRFRIDPLSNRIAAETRMAAGGAEQLLAYGYDGTGAVVQIGERRFERDAHGRPVKVFDGERLVAEYAYNAFGQRIKKVVHAQGAAKTTYFFYDGTQLVAEADGSGQVQAQYVWLDERPVATLHGKDVYAIHADHRGAPLAVTDTGRRPVWQAAVDPWGRAAVTRAGLVLNLRGSNQYYDAETGLHYNTHRYYDPASGRYLSADPLGQAGGLNLYAFAGNDPLSSVDPLGLQSKTAGEVASMSFGDKLVEVLKRTIPLLPGDVKDGVSAAFDDMIANIPTTVAVLAVFTALQATPIGWAVDVLFVGMAYYALGAAGIQLVKTFINVVSSINNARECKDLEAAAKLMSAGLVTVAAMLAERANLGSKVTAVIGSAKNAIKKTPDPNDPKLAKPAPTEVDAKPWRKNEWNKLSRGHRGLQGELEAADQLMKAGWRPIGSTPNPRNIRNEQDYDNYYNQWKGSNGIDGVFERTNPATGKKEYVIVESKSTGGEKPSDPCGTVDRLCLLKSGERQMSDAWVNARIDDIAGSKSQADQIKQAIKEGRTTKIYASSDENGTIFNKIDHVSATDVKIGAAWTP
jgi:RHS repeat-associated protein